MSHDLQGVRRAIAAQPWAITPEKLDEILAVVAFHAAGGRWTPEEIAARIGAPKRPQSAVAGRVATLPLYGMIAPRANMLTEFSGGTTAEAWGAQFQALVDDPAIGAIVLDVDSPGGQVEGVHEVAALVHAARGRKPVVAVANNLMASAAYWIASAADEVVVTSAGQVGSIGVIQVHEDVSEAAAKAGVKYTAIHAGAHKADGMPFTPLSDDARAHMQAEIDHVYGLFLGAVAAHRRVSAEHVATHYGQGRAFRGQRAVDAGLADRVGTLAQVVAELTGGERVTGRRSYAVAADSQFLSVAAVAAATTPLPEVPMPAGEAAASLSIPHLAPAPAPEARSVPVSEQNTAAPTGAAPTVTVTRDERGDQYADVAAAAELHGMQEILTRGLTAGKAPSDIRAEMNAEIRSRLARGPVQNPPVVLSEREEKQYSLARAILAAAGENADNSFEREIHEELMRKLGRNSAKGFLFPTTIRAAGLDSGTSTKGSELKFTQAGSFVDMLRNRARVLQAGATYLPGLDGPVTFPKQNGAGTATWVGENPGSDVGESNFTLTTVSMTAKTIQSTTSFSKQLLRQSVVEVENLVRSDLAAIHALAIDLAAINGSGSSNQPLGVLQNTSVNVVALGTNGAAPDYDDMVDLETAVEEDNADVGPRAYITTPGVKGKLKKTQRFSSTDGEPVWTGGQEGQVNGYAAYSTKQVPSNLTKGTSTTVCHAVLHGVWSQLYVGEWGAAEILVDPYALKKQGMIEVTSFQMVDIMLRHPEAFAVIKDALTS